MRARHGPISRAAETPPRILRREVRQFKWRARPSSPIVVRDNQAPDVDTPQGNRGHEVANPRGLAAHKLRRWQQPSSRCKTRNGQQLEATTTRSTERADRWCGLKAVPGSSRGVRKGTADASPRHPCGEARVGSRSDRAAKATSLQAPRSAQPPISMRWCQRRRDRSPEKVNPRCALPSGGGPRFRASTSSERSGTLSSVASCDTRELHSVHRLKWRKALTGGANWLIGAASQGAAPLVP